MRLTSRMGVLSSFAALLVTGLLLNQCGTDRSDPTGGCQAGDLRCESDMLVICQDGSWKLQEDCALNGKICMDLTCVEQTPETWQDGEERCDKDVLQVCNNETWEEKENCTDDGKICKDLECVEQAGNCQNGDKRCENDVLEVCKNDVWKEKENCTDDGKICQNLECVLEACAQADEGNTRCLNEKLVQVCKKEHWIKDDDCKDDEACMDGACTKWDWTFQELTGENWVETKPA